MTDRERWTVYPLLFMTLGIAVKDRIVNLSNVDTVLCSTLVVRDRKGNEQVIITSTPAGGLVRTQGSGGLGVVVGHSDKVAGLMFVDANGNLHSSLASVQTAPRNLPGPYQPHPDAAQKPAEATGQQPPSESSRPDGAEQIDPAAKENP